MTVSDYLKLKNGSDVRGIATAGVVGEEVNLTEEAVKNIAAAFACWLKTQTGKEKVRVAIGHDSRVSANALSKSAIDGVTATGNDVLFTGLSSTPSTFMLLQKPEKRCDGSIMLTASHLPFNRNGMKFFTQKAGLEGSDVKTLLELAAEGNFPVGNGEVEKASFLDEYAADLVAFVRKETGENEPLKNKKIVVDAGNGAGGFYAEKVLAPLGANTDGSQFLDPDGRFPNHIPTPENKAAMQAISEAVKRNGADFGIIFDTDVDRAGAVDRNGEEINRNRLIALIAGILLKEKQGTIVTDSVTSDGLKTYIESRGGRHHRFKRGYKNVINEAIRLNEAGEYAPLAIETSGHAALKENYFLDDGAYLVTRLLIEFAKQAKAGKDISELIADLPEPKEAAELRPTFKAGYDFKAEGAKIIEDLTAYANTQSFITPAAENYEGIRLNYDSEHGNGWSLVRLSLHEPILPINAESEELGGTEKILRFLYGFLKTYECLDLSVFSKLGINEK